MANIEKNTQDETCPVFRKWAHWYWLVLIVNIVLVTLIYLIFNAV